jgi:predicted RND superfamily exporter protein
VEVRIATTTSPAAVAARDLHAERAFWRHWFANATADAPPSLGVDKGFVTSRTWALLDTEAELATNAWSALGASLFCAFVVVLIAARSARLACLATFSVGAVAASFVAFLVAAGHTLGVAESTCVAVLVGLSLDYVLHVAGAYAQAPPSVKKNRRRRAFWATRATGASVFAGATTTAAAASFLLFQCDAPFFRTFGAFALWTSSVSSVFAVVVFPATCALWGHEARDAGERRRRYVRTVEEL